MAVVNRNEVVTTAESVLRALRQWEKTPSSGDPMIDVLLNDIDRAAHVIESQRRLITSLEVQIQSIPDPSRASDVYL